MHLLTDSHSTKRETMRSPAERWMQQYGDARPIEVRFTAPRQLHDRLIVVDGARVWLLTQSLKDFAGRSPASVIRVDDPVAAALKRDAYAQLWAAAAPL